MERLREELASEGAYHQVSFTYDGDEDTHVGTNVDGGEDNDDDFKLPEKLTVPDHMQIVSIIVDILEDMFQVVDGPFPFISAQDYERA